MEGHLDANCFLYSRFLTQILFFSFFFFQLSHFEKKIWSLITKMTVTSMSISWSLFWLFILNIFFFNSLVVLYVCTFPSYQRTYVEPYVAEKYSYIFLKIVLLKLNFPDEGHLYTSCLFYILTIYHKCFLCHWFHCINFFVIFNEAYDWPNFGWFRLTEFGYL